MVASPVDRCSPFSSCSSDASSAVSAPPTSAPFSPTYSSSPRSPIPSPPAGRHEFRKFQGIYNRTWHVESVLPSAIDLGALCLCGCGDAPGPDTSTLLAQLMMWRLSFSRSSSAAAPSPIHVSQAHAVNHQQRRDTQRANEDRATKTPRAKKKKKGVSDRRCTPPAGLQRPEEVTAVNAHPGK